MFPFKNEVIFNNNPQMFLLAFYFFLTNAEYKAVYFKLVMSVPKSEINLNLSPYLNKSGVVLLVSRSCQKLHKLTKVLLMIKNDNSSAF